MYEYLILFQAVVLVLPVEALELLLLDAALEVAAGAVEVVAGVEGAAGVLGVAGALADAGLLALAGALAEGAADALGAAETPGVVDGTGGVVGTAEAGVESDCRATRCTSKIG